MRKFALVIGVLVLSVTLGAGCSRGNQPTQVGNENVQGNQLFDDKNIGIDFQYNNILQKSSSTSTPGAVSAVFTKRPGSSGLIDTLYFSAKTREAWQQEKRGNQVCESEEQPGCEKWDEDIALYQKALTSKNYDGYYALGANRVTINGVTYVVLVTYNIDRQQYQTKYVAYVNNMRITFVDPATGGLEYGIPFQMNAKNRELVEITADHIAKRQKIDDVKTRARADELYQLVSTVEIKK